MTTITKIAVVMYHGKLSLVAIHYSAYERTVEYICEVNQHEFYKAERGLL